MTPIQSQKCIVGGKHDTQLEQGIKKCIGNMIIAILITKKRQVLFSLYICCWFEDNGYGPKKIIKS